MKQTLHYENVLSYNCGMFFFVDRNITVTSVYTIIIFAWWEKNQTSHILILPGFKVDQKKRVVLFKKKKRCVMQTRSSNDVLFVTYRSPQKHC